MNKTIFALTFIFAATASLADPREREREHNNYRPPAVVQAPVQSHERERDHDYRPHEREWHGDHDYDRGHHFGWGWFFGGILLGDILAHEIDGHWYDDYDREVIRVPVCRDEVVYDAWRQPIYDSWGRIVTRRVCHDEWVYAR